MATFGIEVINNPWIRSFIDKVNIKLQDNKIVYNPFFGKIRLFGNLCIVSMQPVYLNPIIIGIWACLLMWVINGFKITAWQTPGLFMILASFFWSKYFILLMLYIGLRKHKYKDRIKLLSNEEALKRLLEWDK